MNFAVIGLGSFGVKRAKAIKSSKMAKLVCIFDPDEGNAKKAEKELSVPIKSFKEILEDTRINSVKIKIEKPNAIRNAKSVGVEVFKSRSDYEGS